MSLIRFFLLSFVVVQLLHAGGFYLPNKQKKEIGTTYNKGAVKRILTLVDLMNKLYAKSDKEKLLAINKFFNEVPYSSDMKLYNRKDYWANRTEFLGRDRGDCEDYTFAKYFTLAQLGVSKTKMKAFYCKSLTYNQAHMVLAYFRKPKSVPFILGNYNYKILPATKRTDLKPIKLYNGDALYIAKLKKQGKVVPGSKKAALEWIEIINAIRRK
jgi:predicted transglutaminase-like cysteine proteinase